MQTSITCPNYNDPLYQSILRIYGNNVGNERQMIQQTLAEVDLQKILKTILNLKSHNYII